MKKLACIIRYCSSLRGARRATKQSRGIGHVTRLTGSPRPLRGLAMTRLVIILLFSQLFAASLAQAFIVRHIDVEGLQRTSPATVESYLPIKRGQELQPGKTGAILRALYQTGFFDHITLSRDGDTLIIHVVERPTIGQLKISGNSVIPSDKLNTVMKTMDIAEGRVYNPAVLERIKQSLQNQYYQLGRYNARINVTTSPMPRNRVQVKIDISEGVVAKVKRISIIGNHVFDEDTLIKQLDVTTSGIFTFVTQTDRYAEEKLESSLEKLRSYYMDRGYIRFEVKSAQAQITPDRKAVYITIVVDEGQAYTVKDFVIEGKTIVPHAELVQQIPIKRGDTFSRQNVIDAEKAVTKLLGNKGYMFAAITVRPQINDKTHDVILIFDVKQGKRAYVRHITFSDNNRTNDEVLRREMQQWESAPASTTKLDESKRRLSLLPFIRDVDMSVKPVADTNDQVDVNYKVKEDNSATATFKIGYSQVDRVILGAGFNQKNFFGTGSTLGVNLQRSKYEQFYGVDYTDPYYTPDGISRTLALSASRVDPRGAGVNNSYTTHEYKAQVLYGIPVGQEDSVTNRIQTGFGYQNTLVHLIPGGMSNQISSFVNSHGTHFQELDLTLGYSRDSRDKAIFATSGVQQNIFLDVFAPLSSSSITYYSLNYNAKWYQPLYNEFILLSKADLGYGNGLHGASEYPFFRNYYAGGINSVRGFQGYTLGPRDSNGKPFGGNMLADGSLGLIFPNHVSDNLRTSAFFDVGNVYSSADNRKFGGQSIGSGPLRCSVGVEADWLTPLGPIQLSLARALNRQDRPSDYLEAFQFAMGANF
jgi:outer membrane protein insertion porin family